MLNAIKEQPTSAIMTTKGSVTPATPKAGASVKAAAEAGAIVVIDWNSTPGKPMVLACSLFGCSAEERVSTVINKSSLHKANEKIQTYQQERGRGTRMR